MICRMWHGWTNPDKAEAYESYLKNELFPRVERDLKKNGYRGFQLLKLDKGSEVEFVTMLWFESLDNVKSFAGDNSLLLSSGFQSNNFSDDEYKLGLEYAYEDIFFVRGGYNFSQNGSSVNQYLFGATFGAGIHTSIGTTDVSFDYAYRDVKVFEGNHVFSVKLGF